MDEGLNDPAAGLPRKKQSLILKTERKRMIRNLYERYRELINYLIVGGLTTVVSLGTYYGSVLTFLDPQNPIQLQAANILSWVCAVTFAYFANRIFVFRSENPDMVREAGGFVTEAVHGPYGDFNGLALLPGRGHRLAPAAPAQREHGVPALRPLPAPERV